MPLPHDIFTVDRIAKRVVFLLMKGGPRVLSYGSSRGVTSMSDLRRFLKQSRASDPRWDKL